MVKLISRNATDGLHARPLGKIYNSSPCRFGVITLFDNLAKNAKKKLPLSFKQRPGTVKPSLTNQTLVYYVKSDGRRDKIRGNGLCFAQYISFDQSCC